MPKKSRKGSLRDFFMGYGMIFIDKTRLLPGEKLSAKQTDEGDGEHEYATVYRP